MAMKTIIRKEGDSIIVSLTGYLDYETTDVFRESLMRLERQIGDQEVIIDMSELQFVGSSGISAFVQTLRDFNGRSTKKTYYSNVKSEFRKIFAAFDDSGGFEFIESALTRPSKSPNN